MFRIHCFIEHTISGKWLELLKQISPQVTRAAVIRDPGDGMLPNAGREKIIETYYSFPVFSWRMTLDYQFIANPAYNRDRGPVSVIGTRLHTQF